MTQEIEIRLAVRPEDRTRLYRSELLKRLSTRRASTNQLQSIYYDTPDLAMAKQGLSLRVRKTGRAFVQTVKGPNSGSLLSERVEWESRLPNATPDLSAISDDDMRERVRALVADYAIEPKVETDITRTTRHLTTDAGDEIECAFDDGTISSVGDMNGGLSVMEVELELKSGSPASLFELARELNRIVTLKMQTESKSERGLRVLSGRDIQARKPERVVLAEGATAEEAFRTTLRHCLRHMAYNVAAVEARDPGGVHQIRVGLRRLRAAFSAFGKAFHVPRLNALRAQAKNLSDAFGATRELDVFANELLPQVEPEGATPAPVRAVRARLDEVRTHAWDDAVELVRSSAFTDFLLDLGDAAETLVWRSPIGDDAAIFERPALELACKALDAELKKTRKRAKHLSRLNTDERHRLRIALKRLRYAAEFFAPLFPDKYVGPYLKQLSKAQDAFGLLNDASTVQHVLARLMEDPELHNADMLREGAAFVAGWHLGRVPGGWQSARKHWKRLAKTDPFWHAEA